MTIAYMKKGTANKYRQYVMSELITLEPTNFSFGYFEGDEYQCKTWK